MIQSPPLPRRRTIVVVTLLAVCALCYSRLVVRPYDVLVGPQRGGENDLTAYYQPIREFQSQAWARDGRLPAWDPFTQLGRPFAGNPQVGLYYPPNWLCLAFGARILSWLIVAHHLLAGWGTYLLCRRYGFPLPAALLGSVTYMAAPFFLAQSAEGHWAQACIAGWIPWAFLCYERLRRDSPGALLMTSVVFALMTLCGHPQEVFYAGAILTSFLLFDALSRNPATRPAGRLVAGWLFASVICVGLVAVDLLPIYVTSQQATRAAARFSAEEASFYSIGSVNLWQLLDPFVLGGPADYRGPGEFYWETICCFGIVSTLCALVGSLASFRTYPVARYTLLVAVGILFAMGASTPFYATLHQLVPGFGIFRVPSRMLLFCSLAVAVLAAAGASRLIAVAAAMDIHAWFGRRRRSLLAGCFVGAVVLVAATALSNAAASEPSSLFNLNWIYVAGWSTATLVALSMVLYAKTRAEHMALLLVALAAIELSCHARAVTRTVPADRLRGQSEITDFLAEHAGNLRVLADQQLLSDAEAWRHGIVKVRGYDPFMMTRYALITQTLAADRDLASGELAGFVTHPQLPYNPRLVDLLGIRYAVVGHHNDLGNEDWKLISKGTVESRARLRGVEREPLPYAIYENPDPLPRAFVLGIAEAQPLGEHSLAELSKLDPGRRLMLTQDVLPDGPRQQFAPAEIVSYTCNAVTVEARLTQPGYLVLTDLGAAGWSATVDGQPTKILSADIAFRAVPLPAGRHRVAFRFQPPLWWLAALLSSSCWLAVALMLFRSRRSFGIKGPERGILTA